MRNPQNRATTTCARSEPIHGAQQRLQNFTCLNQPLSHASSPAAEIESLHSVNGNDCSKSISPRIEGAFMNRKKLTATLVKAIVGALTASGLLAIATQTASAQQIIVTVPFAFSAGEQLYPSGTYQFTLLSAWKLSMRNMNGGGERFFMVSPKQNGPKEAHASIVFRNVTSLKDLEAIHVPGSDISAELLSSDHVTPKPRAPEQNATLR
jgi:hypothetical protein